jgi:DNA invertase Pin-like site-specific DNA recombinase
MKRYVVYYRSGPHRRGNRTLDEQRGLAQQLVSINKGSQIQEFVEEETGDTRRDRPRPALRKAVAYALENEATLVIASIGRLSRNLHFTTILLESRVPFVCCDMPKANHHTIHVLHALARETARSVGDRTRQALAKAQAEGRGIGSNRPGHWEGREHKRGWRQAVAQSAKLRRQRAAQQYAFLIPEIKARRERGETLPEIVTWLNQTNHTTTAGKPFTQTAVWRIIKRYIGDEYLGNNTRKFAEAR